MKHAIRNPDGHKVRQWLDQISDDLKKAAKLVKAGQLIAVQDTETTHNMVPVFSAFVGIDNLGHATCKPPSTGCRYKMRVIGGSETDAQARVAFRRSWRNGFEPMYKNETITSDMLKGIYVLVAGAACVAYSLAGKRNGLSAKVGMHYTDQMDTYITAEIPVIILE